MQIYNLHEMNTTLVTLSNRKNMAIKEQTFSATFQFTTIAWFINKSYKWYTPIIKYIFIAAVILHKKDKKHIIIYHIKLFIIVQCTMRKSNEGENLFINKNTYILFTKNPNISFISCFDEKTIRATSTFLS